MRLWEWQRAKPLSLSKKRYMKGTQPASACVFTRQVARYVGETLAQVTLLSQKLAVQFPLRLRSPKNCKAKAAGDAMYPNQEEEYRAHQIRLVALLEGRETLQDGSRAADESDDEISFTSDLILSLRRAQMVRAIDRSHRLKKSWRSRCCGRPADCNRYALYLEAML